jgi:hypothetical protein
MDWLNEPAWWQPAFFILITPLFVWFAWTGIRTGRVKLNYLNAFERERQPKRFWLVVCFWVVISLTTMYAAIVSSLRLTQF